MIKRVARWILRRELADLYGRLNYTRFHRDWERERSYDAIMKVSAYQAAEGREMQRRIAAYREAHGHA